MRIVLDTNVLVSGLLNPFGAPGRIAQLVVSGSVRICFDSRILAEYRRVLLYPKLAFDPAAVSVLLDAVEAGGEPVSAAPLPQALPDPDDEPFLEVAAASAAAYLVTGNLRHYPKERRAGVRVVSPADFIAALRKSRG